MYKSLIIIFIPDNLITSCNWCLLSLIIPYLGIKILVIPPLSLILLDKNEKLLKDNDERMIFFTKGVIETVKKLNWIPDIIHLHGWFTSLFPLYLKKLYSDDPIFEKSKIVSSLYSKAFDGNLSKTLSKKIKFDGVDENLDSISTPDFSSLSDIMIRFSDSVIFSSDNIEKDLKSSVKKHSKDSLSFKDSSSEEKLMDFLLKNID